VSRHRSFSVLAGQAAAAYDSVIKENR
jgi:hypothetical protein